MIHANLGPAYQEIGEHLAFLSENPNRPIFLYAEAESASMYAAVFLDRGSDLLYIDPDSKLFHLLTVAWETDEPDKRWTAMSYLSSDGEFTATFSHTVFDHFDPDRRYVGLRRHFGEKPVSYPSLDEGYDALDPANFPGVPSP